MKYFEIIERAQNTSTPPEAIALLAQDADASVRRYAAQNTSTPAEALVLLAQDQNTSVRYYVALNTNTPAEALALLARDQDASIREAAKQNKSYVATKRNIYTLFNQAMSR